MSRAPAGEQASRGWRWGEGIAWLLSAGLLAWLFLPQLGGMVLVWWHDPNYSHGFLVPLISAGIIWHRRHDLARLPRRPSGAGLWVLAAGLVILVAGKLAHELYLQRVSLVPVLWGLAWTAWGWPLARSLFFPLAYLLFMVPLPYMLYDAVAFPLRLVAASLAGGMLRLTGMPVLVEGNVLHLPHAVLDVVDACSGIRSIISLLAAAVIMVHLMLRRGWGKTLVVLLVLPVAVVTNALRVFGAGLLSRYFGKAVLEGTTHDAVGWLVFMAAFGMLAAFTLLLRRLEGKREEAGHGA